jgi:hypothetical protein
MASLLFARQATLKKSTSSRGADGNNNQAGEAYHNFMGSSKNCSV